MGRIVTYQDFVDFGDSNEQRIAAIKQLIFQHKESDFCETARTADKYDAQKNKTIMEAAPILYAMNGMKAIDYTASNHQIASNFFRQLNKQRATYSLGNGVTFTRDGVKEKLGKDFDTDISNAAYLALIHGVCYVFLDVDHLHRFPAYQFAPLWDERNSALRAGVRYWRIDDNHPGYAVLYEEDGFTVYKAERGDDYKIDQPKRAYKLTVQKAAIDDAVGSDDRDEYRAVLEGLELGTEATRTGIIDNARKSRYIELKKDVYTILPEGEYLIESLSRMGIRMDKNRTSEMGRALKKVFRGEISVKESVALAAADVREVFTKKEVPLEEDTDTGLFGEEIGPCPLCGRPVVRGKFSYGCSGYKEGCTFRVNTVILGRPISVSNMKLLLKEGKTAEIRGFISKKSNHPFDAALRLQDGKAVFDFGRGNT